VRVILLGPQRRPTVDGVVRSLGRDGPVATITAGWQEREPDDGELSRLLDGRDTALELYQRWLDVQDRDPVYAAGERALQEILAELQETYLLRLDYALQAVYAVRRRADSRLGAQALAEAVAAVRELDRAHLRQVNSVRGEFFERLPPHDRPVIAEHRAAVARLISEAAAVVVAGGHVNVLADVLHLFNVAAALNDAAREPAAGPTAERPAAGPPAAERPAAGPPAAEPPAAERPAAGRPVIAWSAGAMALTDRIVLFHDRAPQGPGHPEVYGSGLSVLRDVVLLPHARTRLLLDDAPRMAVFARRFAPARCVLLDDGTRIDTDADACPPGTRVLAEDGGVTALEAA
jgi:hypothetical protein